MTQKKFTDGTRREIFMLETETGDLFRELAEAKGMKKGIRLKRQEMKI